MNAPNRNRPVTQAEASGETPPRNRASADYERPRENVADIPDPADLPTNKARAGVRVPGMWLVLAGGIALTLIGYFIGYYLFYT